MSHRRTLVLIQGVNRCVMFFAFSPTLLHWIPRSPDASFWETKPPFAAVAFLSLCVRVCFLHSSVRLFFPPTLSSLPLSPLPFPAFTFHQSHTISHTSPPTYSPRVYRSSWRFLADSTSPPLSTLSVSWVPGISFPLRLSQNFIRHDPCSYCILYVCFSPFSSAPSLFSSRARALSQPACSSLETICFSANLRSHIPSIALCGDPLKLA